MEEQKLAKSKKKKDVDEQKVQAEAEAAEVRQEESKPEEQAADEEMAGLPPVDIYSLLKYFIGLLGAQAWQWMGVIKNPMTGQVGKDLPQAKVAIDSISALITQIESKLDESEQREIRNMLSDLRINFVQQSARES